MPAFDGEFFEDALRRAARALCEEEEAPAARPSPGFRLRIFALYLRTRRRLDRRERARERALRPSPAGPALPARPRRFVSLATAATLVVLLACGAACAGYDGYLRFLLRDYEIYSEIELVPKEGTKPRPERFDPAPRAVYYPAFVPEGYVLEESGHNELDDYYVYRNGEDWISISAIDMSNDPTVGIDTEDAEIREITINGMEGVCIQNADITIIFHDDRYLFQVYSPQSNEKILVQIAENVKIKNNS